VRLLKEVFFSFLKKITSFLLSRFFFSPSCLVFSSLFLHWKRSWSLITSLVYNAIIFYIHFTYCVYYLFAVVSFLVPCGYSFNVLMFRTSGWLLVMMGILEGVDLCWMILVFIEMSCLSPKCPIKQNHLWIRDQQLKVGLKPFLWR